MTICLSRAGALPIVCAAALLLGCGEASNPTVKVTGTVTVEGSPLDNVSVTFTPEKGRPGTGVTDAQGRFTISTFAKNDGAEVGKHKVTISSGPSDAPEPMPGTPEYAARAQQAQRFAARYRGLDTTDLAVEVKRGEKNDFPFDLKKQ